MKNKANNYQTTIALTIAIGLGTFIRLVHVTGLDFPLNDGGFFYAMIRDLQKANYAIPDFASYNLTNIPYAYPPLSFYLAGFISEISKLPILDIIRWLPAIISILTIPAFYFIAREILKSESLAILASYAFSLLPTSFDWLIVGGGLTRAPGYLFAILTIYQAYQLFHHDGWKYYITTTLLFSLTVLSHPGTTWFTVYSVAVLLFFSNKKYVSNIKKSIIVTLGSILLTSPWWMTIIRQHGINTLLAPFQTESFSLVAFLTPLTFLQTNEPLLDILGVIGLLGLFACIRDKKYLLPIWLGTVFLFEPRLSPTYSVLPMAMIVAYGLQNIVLTSFRNSAENQYRGELSQYLSGWLPKVVLGYVLLYAFIAAFISPSYQSLSASQQDSMEWVRSNTSQSDIFLVLTGISEYGIDPISEWFPALTERTNLTTPQGHEWLPNQDFNHRAQLHKELQACATEDSKCFQGWVEKSKVIYTHIYLAKLSPNDHPCCQLLMSELINIHSFSVLYDGPGATVLQLPNNRP